MKRYQAAKLTRARYLSGFNMSDLLELLQNISSSRLGEQPPSTSDVDLQRKRIDSLKLSPSVRSVSFADRVEVKALDAHMDGIDVGKASSALDVKRALVSYLLNDDPVPTPWSPAEQHCIEACIITLTDQSSMQFERFFDPAATLYAPTTASTRTNTTPTVTPLKRRGGGPARSAAPVFASASPRTLSRTTAKALLLRQQAAFNSPQHAEPLLLADRPSSSAPRATRPTPVPGSPAAASTSSAAGLRLSGMLDHRRVPPDARRRLDQLRLEAAAWSEAQARHQCERGIVARVAALLHVPALQGTACGLLADLGGRWPAALAGAAGDVARELPLALARVRARADALHLLRTLAACGEAGCSAVTGSPALMGELTEMLCCRPVTSGLDPSAAGADSIMAAQRQPGVPDVKPCGRRGEAWGPGLISIGTSSRPARETSSSPSWLPALGTLSQASVVAALSEAATAATILLSLLSSPATAAAVCRLHRTAVDPVCLLFGCLAPEHETEQREQVLKMLLGKHVWCSALMGDVRCYR